MKLKSKLNSNTNEIQNANEIQTQMKLKRKWNLNVNEIQTQK